MKILSVFSAKGSSEKLFVNSMENACKNTISIKFYNQAKYYQLRVLGPYLLDELYRNKDRTLLSMYEEIYSLARDVDILIVDHENYLHPDFLDELKKVCYTVFYTTDDPESSYLKSMPYIPFFDHVFCCSVMHSDKIKMVDKLKFWGARRADFRAYGLYKDRQVVNEEELEEVLSRKKEQIVYVGGPYSKSDFLIELKKVGVFNNLN